MDKSAIIAGATGLIGNALVQLLIKDERYERIIVLTRRPLQQKDEKIKQLIINDFDELAHHLRDTTADEVFCCLGTTMKKARTKENFRKVDYNYPLRLAQLTKSQGVQKYLLVSALGANPSSSVFYNKVKGEIEVAIKKIGFESYHIFRPSLLLGSRGEERAGEDAAKTFFKIFGFLFVGPLKKYQAIRHDKVARAMLYMANTDQKGVFIHESSTMQKF
ncbi:MAG: oxidoreductase [Fulvivirga sp.]|nr:oxidoreductase [Fulvivirga sp.]